MTVTTQVVDAVGAAAAVLVAAGPAPAAVVVVVVFELVEVVVVVAVAVAVVEGMLMQCAEAVGFRTVRVAEEEGEEEVQEKEEEEEEEATRSCRLHARWKWRSTSFDVHCVPRTVRSCCVIQVSLAGASWRKGCGCCTTMTLVRRKHA